MKKDIISSGISIGLSGVAVYISAIVGGLIGTLLGMNLFVLGTIPTFADPGADLINLLVTGLLLGVGLMFGVVITSYVKQMFGLDD